MVCNKRLRFEFQIIVSQGAVPHAPPADPTNYANIQTLFEASGPERHPVQDA